MDVAKSIGELLFKNKVIVVPGFGGFTTDHKSATIDFVQSSMTPPSKTIAFNENLKLNDGVLINFLQKEYDVSVEEAQKAIDDFIKKVKETLAKKEIVEIPKVGRIYLDYENKMKFLPEGTNFNTDSFGLPTVKSKPIVRKPIAEKVRAGAAAQSFSNTRKSATTSSTGAATYASKSNEKDWASKTLWAILAVAAIVICVSMYMIFRTPTAPNPEVAEQQIDEDRLNKSPGDDEQFMDDDPEDIEDFAMDDENSDDSIDTATEPEEEIDTEGTTLSPRDKEVFIVIHSLTKKSGAERFLKTLAKDGFNAASVHEGKWYRVGVEFVYQNEEELDDLKSQLKELYKTTLVVWEGGKGKAN